MQIKNWYASELLSYKAGWRTGSWKIGKDKYVLSVTGQHHFAEHIFWRNTWLTLEQRLYIWFLLMAREILACFLNWNKSMHCFSGRFLWSTCSTLLLLWLSTGSTSESREFNGKKITVSQFKKREHKKEKGGERERKKDARIQFLVAILFGWYRKYIGKYIQAWNTL